MNVTRTIRQAPAPKVYIYERGKGNILDRKDAKISFTPKSEKILQGYSFSLSVGDVAGSFNLHFFPETSDNKHLFDKIKLLDIVTIYEEDATNKELLFDRPIFTGIIRTKKYSSQASESGATRQLAVSGTAVTGLVTQYYVNLDVRATALSKQMATNADIAKRLTTEFAGTDKTVKKAIEIVWEYFDDISSKGSTVTTGIKEIIDKTMGVNSLFDIPSDLKFHYELKSFLHGEATQDFFSLIDGIIPEPVYEKFAYTSFKAESSGKMKIKIRKCPFSPKDWKSVFNRRLEATEIKSFDLTESDNEIYTVFYSYVEGSAMDADRGMILSTMKESGVPTTLKEYEEAFNIYGYRPLICHFLGYGKLDGKEDAKTEDKIKELNQELLEWYGKLYEMLSGTITLAMTYDKKPIMPGEVIGFLGGEFYVEGISHSWTYGSGGEISLSVSRGGKYEDGKFSKLEEVSSTSRLLELKGVS